MAALATRSDPFHIRLTPVEREMVEELAAKLGFHSLADAVRYSVRSTVERQQVAA